jgi:hypothetical protein
MHGTALRKINSIVFQFVRYRDPRNWYFLFLRRIQPLEPAYPATQSRLFLQ